MPGRTLTEKRHTLGLHLFPVFVVPVVAIMQVHVDSDASHKRRHITEHLAILRSICHEFHQPVQSDDKRVLAVVYCLCLFDQLLGGLIRSHEVLLAKYDPIGNPRIKLSGVVSFLNYDGVGLNKTIPKSGRAVPLGLEAEFIG